MYQDLLARIKNAQMAKKESLQARFSKFDFAVAKILGESGYVHDVQKRNIGKKSFIELKLRYKNNRPAMTDFRIMSKPSRHLYRGQSELRSVKQGYGIAVLSTSSGVMTQSEARKKKVGGEYLFEIW